jgi:hypothetical protein
MYDLSFHIGKLLPMIELAMDVGVIALAALKVRRIFFEE